MVGTSSYTKRKQMDDRTKDEKFWDRVAGSYDQEEQRDHKKLLGLIEWTKSYLKPTDRVLDFGCGTGWITNEIAGAVQCIQGIDRSEQMIALARNKTATKALSNIRYEQSDLFDAQWEEGTYDAVLAFYVLHLVEEPLVTLQRIHTLLKPGGVFIAVTPCMGEQPVFNLGCKVLGKIGVIPTIQSLTSTRVSTLLTDSGFSIMTLQKLEGTQHQYFTIAKR